MVQQLAVAIWNWVRTHPSLTMWTFVGSLVLTIGGLIAVPLAVTYMPSDHFLDAAQQRRRFTHRHPLVALLLRTLRNVLGLVLIVLGVIMLFVPGPGVVALLAGLSLAEFPGRRRLELWLVLLPGVLPQIQRLRAKAGQPPLVLPTETNP